MNEKKFGEEYAREKGFVKSEIYKGQDNIRSVLSFVISLFSVICCPITIFGVVFGILGIVFSCLSKRKRGCFDRLSVSGFVIGVFGIIIGILTTVLLVLHLTYIINL